VKRVVNEFQDKIRTRGDIDLDAIDTSVSTMSRFDRYAIAPQMGLTCSSEYYRVASSGLWLSHIRVPTIFVHARNDPIVPGDLIRTDDFKANPNLFSCITQEGGHSMDWPCGIFCEKSWSAGVVERFIRYCLMSA
jgi:predicted alpha/beta-fold hydrolase